MQNAYFHLCIWLCITLPKQCCVCAFEEQLMIITSHLLKEKKKKERIKLFLVPTCPPPNPIPHHSFSPTTPLFWLALSFLSFIFFLFSLLKHTHTHTHTHSFPHSPTGFHSKQHHLTIIFPARSPEKYLGTPKHLHHFIWGKSSNLFWWVLCSCLRLFYPSFYNDIHVI